MMMNRFLVGLLFLLAAIPAEATTYYVNKAGNNSPNNCTTAQSPTDNQALLTIGAGLACASAGDIVEIGAGSYNEGFACGAFTSGTVGNESVVRGEAGQTVTITGSSSGMAACIYNKSYIQFRNLVFNGQSETVNLGILLGGTSAGGFNHHLTFDDIEITQYKANDSAGFTFGTAGSHDITIKNSHFHHGGTTGAALNSHALYITGYNNIVEDSEFDNWYKMGIQLYLSGQVSNGVSGNIIRRNRIHHNGSFGYLLSSGTGNVAYNNLLYNNGGTIAGTGGGWINYGCSGCRILNEAAVNNTGSGIRVEAGQANSEVRNLIAVGNSTSNLSGVPAIASNNSTSGSVGTYFTDAANGDFTYVVGSPAVDTGVDLSATFTTDFAGTSRPQGAVNLWDRGPYELVTATDSLTLTNPNGGTLGVTGSTQTATWTKTGTGIANVKLSYDAASCGGAFATTLVASTPANNLSVSFTAPAATTTGCFKIEDAADGSPSDTSDSLVTITASQGGSLTKILSDNTTGTKIGDINGSPDCSLDQSHPTTNYASNTILGVYKYGSSTSHATHLVKFAGLSQIPTNATLTSVTFGEFVQGGSGAPAQTFDIFRMLRDWDEAQATWEVYSTGNSWTTAGGRGADTDRGASAVAQLTSIDLTAQYRTVTQTSGNLFDLVQGWINGTIANYGLQIDRNGAGGDSTYRDLTSSEGTDAQRPYLEIIYTVSAATITLTQPLGATHYFPGDSIAIRWSSNGLTGDVKAELSVNDGVNYLTIIPRIGYDASDAVWTVTNKVACRACRVKVTSLTDGAVSSVSPAFKIASVTNKRRP